MSDTRKDLPPVSSPNFLEKVREALSVYMGNRGDRLDRGVTLRDLTESGMVVLRPGYRNGSGGVSPIGGAGPEAGGAYEPNLTPPPIPAGFTATAAISNLLVECSPQTYTQGHGHAKSVLYGAQWVSGDLPVFSDAVVLTEFSGTVTSHATNPSTTWHLWLKWVTVDGVYSTSPAGGTNGIVTRTGEDVALLLDALTGEITQSQLFQSLGERIDLIDGASGLAGSVNARVLAEAQARADGLLAEAEARGTAINSVNTLRAEGDAQIAGTVTTLTSIVEDNNNQLIAAVQTEATTRADADSAEASSRTTLASALRTEIGQGDTATQNTAQAYVDTNFYTKTNRDSAVAAQNSTLRTEFASADATTLSSAQNYTYSRATIDSSQTTQTNSITSAYQVADAATLSDSEAYVQGYAYTKAQADSAAAGQVAVVAARLDTGDFAAVKTESSASASSVTGLSAQYTVKLDVNGKVSGFGLASTGPTGAGSTFEIRADRFVIAAPSGSAAGYVPFSVLATPTVIGGITLPAGVYAQNAFIQDAQITTAKIADLAVDSAKIVDLAVNTAKIANAAITTAKIGGAQITTAKIADAAITTALIDDAAITSAKIQDAAITSANIGDLQVRSIHVTSSQLLIRNSLASVTNQIAILNNQSSANIGELVFNSVQQLKSFTVFARVQISVTEVGMRYVDVYYYTSYKNASGVWTQDNYRGYETANIFNSYGTSSVIGFCPAISSSLATNAFFGADSSTPEYRVRAVVSVRHNQDTGVTYIYDRALSGYASI
jgi:hypothetical protein